MAEPYESATSRETPGFSQHPDELAIQDFTSAAPSSERPSWAVTGRFSGMLGCSSRGTRSARGYPGGYTGRCRDRPWGRCTINTDVLSRHSCHSLETPGLHVRCWSRTCLTSCQRRIGLLHQDGHLTVSLAESHQSVQERVATGGRSL